MLESENVAQIRERLATLEQSDRDTRQDIGEMKAELKGHGVLLQSIRTTLDQLSGGRRAAMWIFGALGTAIGVAATLLTGHWRGH